MADSPQCDRRVFLQATLAGCAAATPLARGRLLDAAEADASPVAAPSFLDDGFESLRRDTAKLGKPGWRGVLDYAVSLHERGTHPANDLFPHPWEELGVGYGLRAFGHWDTVFIAFDVMRGFPLHARNQLLNNLANQRADGFVPGCLFIDRPWLPEPHRHVPYWNHQAGYPPVWPLAVEAYFQQRGDRDLLAACFEPLVRQISWFNANRRAEPAGYWYSIKKWENGVDDDLRYAEVTPSAAKPLSCIDATSHVASMYDHAVKWGQRLGEPVEQFQQNLAALTDYIRTQLWVESEGYFYDHWAVDDPNRITSFVGMWPVVLGIASDEQAKRVVEQQILNPKRFFTKHPIPTIGINDPRFELLMWHGPAWNSMTYMAATGCARYGHHDAARGVLERALDNTAAQFNRTGKIWEFYDPFGGPPEEVKREVVEPQGRPHVDYMGHNPLLAMARLHDALAAG